MTFFESGREGGQKMDVRKKVITQTAVCVIFFLIIAIVMLA